MISPPSTSHRVADAKPENTTWAGATASTMASVKNSNPTTCSGSEPPAHSPTVNTASAASCIISTEPMHAAALAVCTVGLWAAGSLPDHVVGLLFFTLAMVLAVAPAQVV